MSKIQKPVGQATAKAVVLTEAESSDASRFDGKLALNVTFTLLRVVAALLFMEAGSPKLFGWFGGIPPTGVAAAFMTQAWFAGILEVLGGAAILLGLFTRPVAFLLAGEMAIGYFQFHAPNGFLPIKNHGEPAILFCFIWLFISAYGGGDWSLDALFRRNRLAARAGL